jgi:hypothetical protein
VARDEILKGLLGLMANETNSTAISKHYFHDSLLEEKEREDKGSSNDPADAGFLKELEQSEPNSSQDSAVSAMATVLAKKRLELGAGSSGQNGCESDPSAENGSKKRPVSHLKPRKPKMVHDDDDTPSPLKYPRCRPRQISGNGRGGHGQRPLPIGLGGKIEKEQWARYPIATEEGETSG